MDRHYLYSLNLNFSNPKIHKTEGSYFNITNGSDITVLGTGQNDLINYVKIKRGNGYFYVNLQPFIS